MSMVKDKQKALKDDDGSHPVGTGVGASSGAIVGAVAGTAVAGPIGALAGELDPSSFVRIHRGAIINLDRIQEVQPWFSGDCIVLLTTGAKLRLTRSYRRAFETRS